MGIKHPAVYERTVRAVFKIVNSPHDTARLGLFRGKAVKRRRMRLKREWRRLLRSVGLNGVPRTHH